MFNTTTLLAPLYIVEFMVELRLTKLLDAITLAMNTCYQNKAFCLNLLSCRVQLGLSFNLFALQEE